MPELNPRQLEAVRYIDGPVLVLAGAGSGKTRVITHKIIHLVKKCDIAARHIAAVTFTNKAAREMKQRVSEMATGEALRGLKVSTFHTLALNILRAEHKHLGYKAGFSIFDAQDAGQLLSELMRKEFGADGDQVNSMQWRISGWKNDQIGPEQALRRAGDEIDTAAAHLYASYNRHLKAYNAFDFDDLIGKPVELFRDHPEVLEKWQNKIRYLLVDEYQDTNSCQYELVKQLVGLGGKLTVVGDDDQSIYAWRGARPENLNQLQEDFPKLKVIKLEQNYRSMGRILKAANQLIDNNPHVFEKRLWSELGYGDPIRVVECRSDVHEAERVVSELVTHRFKHNTRYSDYAILYRGNHQARHFEGTLREQRVPYFLSGGTSFFERSEIKDIFAYLRLISNPADDAAFLRIVNTPRREVGPNTLEKLGRYATERGISLLAACSEMGLEQTLAERPLTRVRQFAEWVAQMHERAQQGEPANAVRTLISDIDYEGWLNDTCKDLKGAERRMENVFSLVEWITRLGQEEGKGETLAELVSYLSLMDVLNRQNEDEADDQVTMMTLHASKGLEFPHVFVVGMEEELLPHRVSLEEGNVEEERRLAYVGITRAQKTLTFTYAAKRRRYGEVISCEPSRFLDELPQDDLQWEGGRHKLAPEQAQERGQAHIANLKNLLGG